MSVPRHLGVTDSGDGDNDKETGNVKDGESDADKIYLEYVNLDRLIDAISLVVGDDSAVADVAGDDATETEEDADAEESSEAEIADYFWEDERTISSAASKFFNLLAAQQ